MSFNGLRAPVRYRLSRPSRCPAFPQIPPRPPLISLFRAKRVRAAPSAPVIGPDPIYAPGAERIDDLWHAAVNGGGRYFSARSPESLAQALSASLSAIRAATAAAAAAASATSSQEPA